MTSGLTAVIAGYRLTVATEMKWSWINSVCALPCVLQLVGAAVCQCGNG